MSDEVEAVARAIAAAIPTFFSDSAEKAARAAIAALDKAREKPKRPGKPLTGKYVCIHCGEKYYGRAGFHPCAAPSPKAEA